MSTCARLYLRSILRFHRSRKTSAPRTLGINLRCRGLLCGCPFGRSDYIRRSSINDPHTIHGKNKPGGGRAVWDFGGGKDATGSGRHKGAFVLSSAGTSHQWVGGYGCATLLQQVRLPRQHKPMGMYERVWNPPVCEPLFFDIDSFPSYSSPN